MLCPFGTTSKLLMTISIAAGTGFCLPARAAANPRHMAYRIGGSRATVDVGAGCSLTLETATDTMAPKYGMWRERSFESSRLRLHGCRDSSGIHQGRDGLTRLVQRFSTIETTEG